MKWYKLDLRISATAIAIFLILILILTTDDYHHYIAQSIANIMSQTMASSGASSSQSTAPSQTATNISISKNGQTGTFTLSPIPENTSYTLLQLTTLYNDIQNGKEPLLFEFYYALARMQLLDIIAGGRETYHAISFPTWGF
jgi:hypothetical protein